MQDRNGVEISVSCRVREADFNYGVGTVVSVEVPVEGGGFNVGVDWDDKRLGGPVFSEDGGGRGAEHLEVIEELEDGVDGGTPVGQFSELDLKMQRFKQRFGHTPTTSEAELSEQEWDELEEEGGGEGRAGGRAQADAAGGERDEAPPSGFASIVKSGARIKICMGMPAKWYGALVGDEKDEQTLVGFDDGDTQLFPTSELHDNLKAEMLLAAVPSEGGVIANVQGYAGRASKFLTYDNRGTTKVIGLFITDAHPPQVAGLAVHSEVHVRPDAFEKRATRGAQNMQDRLGLHSFLRGDIVEYKQVEKDDVPPSAVVYGVIEAEAVQDDPQVRRILVLYDRSGVFHLGTWPAWRRLPKPGLTEEFDCHNNEHVATCTAEECTKMMEAFTLSLSSGTLSCIGTRHQMKGKAAEAPPRLKQARADAKHAERRAEAERVAQAKKDRVEKEREKSRRAREAEKEARKKKGKGKHDQRKHERSPRGERSSPPPWSPPPHAETSPSPRKHKKRKREEPSSSSSSNSSSSRLSTPYSAQERKLELAAEEAAHLARLRTAVARDERKRHERKRKHKKEKRRHR